MSKQNLTKKEIQKKKDNYCNISLATAGAAIAGVIASPTIIVTVLLAAAGTGTCYYFLSKIKALNEVEKNL